MSISANGTGSDRGWPLSGNQARTRAAERSSLPGEPIQPGESRANTGSTAEEAVDRAASQSHGFGDGIGPADDFITDPDLLQAIAESGALAEDFVLALLPSGQRIGIERNSGEEVKVYARSRRRGDTGGIYTGRYRSFRFDCQERRWVDGKPPPGARQIRNFLRPFFEIGRDADPARVGIQTIDLRPTSGAERGEITDQGEDPMGAKAPLPNLLPAPSPPQSESGSSSGGPSPARKADPEMGPQSGTLRGRLLLRAREWLCRSRAGRRWLGVPRPRPREIVILRDLGS